MFSDHLAHSVINIFLCGMLFNEKLLVIYSDARYNKGSQLRLLRVTAGETLQIPLTRHHNDLLFFPVPGLLGSG